MKPKGETKTNYVHKKRRYRELCIVSTQNFFSVNKSWNIANLRFFGCRLSQKELMIGGLKKKMILFAYMLLKAKPFHYFTMWYNLLCCH